MSDRAQRWKAVPLFLAGALVGTLLIEPVGAHFIQNTRHLGKHAWKQVIRDRVYTRQQANTRYYTKAQLDRGKAPGCKGVAPDDVMIRVGPVCVDAYEASIWDAPVGGNQITGPIPCAVNGQDCKGKIFARSVAGVEPGAFTTWFQALAALANSGKRLPSSTEWQMAAQGTPDSTACNISTGAVAETGANPDCVSEWGAFDMVGNFWEWVADWDEVAADCQNWSAGAFGEDITCIGRMDGDGNNHFPSALIRGGYYNHGTDAGVFAFDARFHPAVASSFVGFRGVR